jgi:hypothetical protein
MSFRLDTSLEFAAPLMAERANQTVGQDIIKPLHHTVALMQKTNS